MDQRISQFDNTTTLPSSDDYIPLDGVSNGTRKMKANLFLNASSSAIVGLATTSTNPPTPTSVVRYDINSSTSAQTFTNFKNASGTAITVSANTNGYFLWDTAGYWDFITLAISADILKQEDINVSGGIAGYDSVKKLILNNNEDGTPITLTLHTGGAYSGSTTTPTTTSAYAAWSYADIIDISNYTSFIARLNYSGTSDQYVIKFFDANSAIISGTSVLFNSSNFNTNVNITKPSGAKFAAISFLTVATFTLTANTDGGSEVYVTPTSFDSYVEGNTDLKKLIKNTTADPSALALTMHTGGAYNDTTGTPNTGTAYAAWSYADLVDVSAYYKLNSKFTYGGTATQYVFRFFNSAMGYLGAFAFDSTNFNTNVTINLPANTKYAAISFLTVASITINGVKQSDILNVRMSDFPTLFSSEVSKNTSISQYANGYWKGKKILWVGTSIPETGYPQKLGTLLGANVVNVARGSSMARRGSLATSEADPMGVAGVNFQSIYRSLMQSVADKQWLFDNWTWLMANASGTAESLSATVRADALACSYENRILPHINDTDLLVIDHGYNDRFGSRETAEQWATVPTDSRNTLTFIGAINALIDLFTAVNPRQRIAFIAHYTDEEDHQYKDSIYLAQLALAEYWKAPIFKTYEHSGFNNQPVTTTGYWQNAGQANTALWIPSGGTSRTTTVKNCWLDDNLHPHSQLTQQLLANIMAPFINNIR